jgi:hypothetical protein
VLQIVPGDGLAGRLGDAIDVEEALRAPRVMAVESHREAIERILRRAHQVIPHDEDGEDQRGCGQEPALGAARH